MAEPAAATAVEATAAAPPPSSYAALRAAARSGGNAAARGAQQVGQVVQAEATVAREAVANELGDPALRLATQQAADAARARALQMQQQSVVAATNMHAAATDMAQRTAVQASAMAEQAGQMTLAAADVARQQFDQRWNDVLNQERQLALEAQKLEKYERQLLTLMRNEAPNFPPVHCCCIEPVVFHSIPLEVPPERQTFVKLSFYNFWFACFLLIYNAILAIALMFTSNKEKKSNPDGMTSHVVIACIECVGVVLAFVVWYWPVYKAASTGSSSQHIMCYIGLWVGIIYNALMTAGPVGYGGCGFLFGLAMQDAKGDNAFYPCIAAAIGFGAQAVTFFAMFCRMKCTYGVEDKASMASANAEMARDSVLGGLRV